MVDFANINLEFHLLYDKFNYKKRRCFLQGFLIILQYFTNYKTFAVLWNMIRQLPLKSLEPLIFRCPLNYMQFHCMN